MRTFNFRILLFIPGVLLGALSSTLSGSLNAQPLSETPFAVLEHKPRPADHFTQGLYFDGQRWFESSGLYGRSWLAEYTDPGAKPLRRKWLAANRFAEGLTVLGDKIYLLTYRAGELQIYSADLQLEKTLKYRGEGWGLTGNGAQLIMSDGSDTLTFRNPHTFAIERTIKVQGGGEEWQNLNELEFAGGFIWANIWMDTRVLAIDPASGKVQGILNLKSLKPATNHPDVVANGIAWDKKKNGLWVTGKYWPHLTLIRPQGLGFGPTESGSKPVSAKPPAET